MPHQCTNCGRAFADGSKEMLGGCPDCGGNKFQFQPKGAVDDGTEKAAAGPADDRAGGANGGRVPTDVGEVDARSPSGPAVDDQPGSAVDDQPDDDIIEAPVEPVEASASDVEDSAQASARRSVVTEDELPPVDRAAGEEESPAEPEKDQDRPDLAQLRKELNEQFESIKILQPGEYELNLMELYDREEYIIALEEDGRYVIEVPDTWREAE